MFKGRFLFECSLPSLWPCEHRATHCRPKLSMVWCLFEALSVSIWASSYTSGVTVEVLTDSSLGFSSCAISGPSLSAIPFIARVSFGEALYLNSVLPNPQGGNFLEFFYYASLDEICTWVISRRLNVNRWLWLLRSDS